MDGAAEPGLRLDFRMAGRERDDVWLRDEAGRVLGDLVNALGRDRLRAVVVAGSVARGEGGVLWKQEKVARVISDLDVYVVAARDDEGGLRDARSRMSERLSPSPLTAEIGITTAETLANLPETIANHSLVTEARVVWGDPDVLRGARAFEARSIPREDALNLVLNRAAEEMIARAASRRGAPAEDAALGIFVRGIKTVADLGLAVLMARGNYATGYRGRGARVAAAMTEEPRLGASLPGRFDASVESACGWKLAPEWGGLAGQIPGTDGYPEAARRWRVERIAATRGFLRWYIGESGDLLGALGRSEPLARAARAWARSARGSFAAAGRAVSRIVSGRVRPSPRLAAQLAALALFLASDDAAEGATDREFEDAVLEEWGREIMGWGKA